MPSFLCLHDDDLATLLVGLCTWVLLLAAAWLVLLLVLLALEPCAGRELTALAGCPVWLRAALLGVVAGGALAAPASAADHPRLPTPTTRVTAGIADGLPLPDRVETPPRPAAQAVVVRPGDSLWRITERRLPPTASIADVDRGWRRLYERNRARIGADPDRIEPGLRLRATGPSDRSEENR